MIACKPSPKEIEFGKDACDYCRMSIVDKSHAAELVSTKGKAFKFDAIECMVHFRNEKTQTDFALDLVMDFQNPGNFLKASDATFLISPHIPSPMGAYLSAFSSMDEAQMVKNDGENLILDYEGLLDHMEQYQPTNHAYK